MSAVRVVLAVAVAAALFGAAVPAVEDARVAVADSSLRAELVRLGAAAEALADRSDPVAPEDEGARTHVVVRIPERSWATAGTAFVAVGAPGRNRARHPADPVPGLTWRVVGGRTRTLRTGVPLYSASGTRLVLRRPGRHRLRLALVAVDGSEAVVVSRARAFKYEAGATRSHARVRTGASRR